MTPRMRARLARTVLTCFAVAKWTVGAVGAALFVAALFTVPHLAFLTAAGVLLVGIVALWIWADEHRHDDDADGVASPRHAGQPQVPPSDVLS